MTRSRAKRIQPQNNTNIHKMIYIFLAIYLLSAFGNWWYISKAHYHPNSIFEYVEPDINDWVFVLTPILKTFSFASFCKGWKNHGKRFGERREVTTKFWKTKW